MSSIEFKDRLRQARVAAGMSQTELGKLCEIAPTQVSRYESGRAVPRPYLAARLAAILKVDPQWLAYGHADAPYYAPKEAQTVAVELHMPADMYGHYLDLAQNSRRLVDAQIIASLDELQSLRNQVDELKASLQDQRSMSALQLPSRLHAAISEAATDTGRSFASEIVFRLEKTFDEPRVNLERTFDQEISALRTKDDALSLRSELIKGRMDSLDLRRQLFAFEMTNATKLAKSDSDFEKMESDIAVKVGGLEAELSGLRAELDDLAEERKAGLERLLELRQMMKSARVVLAEGLAEALRNRKPASGD